MNQQRDAFQHDRSGGNGDFRLTSVPFKDAVLPSSKKCKKNGDGGHRQYQNGHIVGAGPGPGPGQGQSQGHGGRGFRAGGYVAGRSGLMFVRYLPTVNLPNIKRWILMAIGLSVVSLVFLSYYVANFHLHSLMHTPPEPTFRCHGGHRTTEDGGPGNEVDSSTSNDHDSMASLRIDSKVLVFAETQYSRLGREICVILEANRMRYKLEVAGKSLPLLTNLDKGKFSVIVFENLERYVNMDKWNRELLNKYCREYKVGIVGFAPQNEKSLIGAQLKGFPLYRHSNVGVRDCHLNPASPILRVTRAGETCQGKLPGDDWTVFQPNHSTYVPLALARAAIDSAIDPAKSKQLITVVQDQGLLDGIQRVFFGYGFRFWLHRLLFLDSLSYLSHGKLSISLHRYILIDIDDIFVGKSGTRMKREDVQALLDAQNRLRRLVPGFQFNLGFSGKFYHTGTADENRGDEMLLEHVDEFWWFSHMWRHTQPHLFDNVTELEYEMTQNKMFAKEHRIPTNLGYSVAPHHSGVYPVHEPLYAAWKNIWDVRVTSTEEYPHLRPARLRRGFIHRNLLVLPRQTCGLYTHTIFIDQYPGGRQKLEMSIHGGELFQTIVNNPMNIFMTHLSNYGNDRLALYTFESVMKFVQCWTNLKLRTVSPLQLAEKYFQAYPEEVDPIWMNPCDDKRHLTIWSPQKSCQQLPHFLVIGPQKTGTTALYTFLSMHPSIVSNYPSPETFEEVQFFNGRNYFRGLDWYMSFFPVPENSSAKFLFEKSATYFDGDLVPLRAHALLPRTKLVTILVSPTKRAYSWYQHIRSHKDELALNYTFYDVVTATDGSPRKLRELRNRCLAPGMYAQHLERWLNFFPSQQLMIIDGEMLRTDPANILNKLQRFLKIKPFFDYADRLRYDPKKGFFCQVLNGDRTKCLGKSKGRQYPPMDKQSEKILHAFYMSHNVALSKLLTKLGQPVPDWLQKDLTDLQ